LRPDGNRAVPAGRKGGENGCTRKSPLSI
jgi:hypothetical protein